MSQTTASSNPIRPRSFRCCARIAAALTLTLTLSLGAAEPANSYAASIEKLDPFDTTGLDSGVANVLRNYYARNFTDADTWAAVESIRLDGVLHHSLGELPFSAFKKKPNLIRIVLGVDERHEIIMAYDGVRAWQRNTRLSALASNMPEDEALNFIRDATTGGHLLYPGIEGKRIELVGTALVRDKRTYELRITLPDGQVIRSFIEMLSYAEIQQITTNNVSGKEEVTQHSNFRMVQGIRIPFANRLTIDGEEVHRSRLDTIKMNQGVTSWMFERPLGVDDGSGANSPADTNASMESLGTQGSASGSNSFFDIDVGDDG